ncbi:hypothetical protein MKW92_023244 [Papaver armeniacum]|nr:hypothetical protein MKW92_023244 [Papaver armeniacum]
MRLVQLIVVFLVCLSTTTVKAEDPYKFFTWTVTYGKLAPLGVSQQVILINGQFPGPTLDVVTNDNLIINVINKLDEPFLLTCKGRTHGKMESWVQIVLFLQTQTTHTKCKPRDQIGTYSYFPSTAFHKAAGGFGGINIYARPRIPVPYALPTADFTLPIGDWYRTNHKVLRKWLDSGKALASPDGLLLNGRQTSSFFSGDRGKTYMFRITNIGLSTSINFRIQSHKMKLVECEGAHTVQSFYDSLDIHVGQSFSVLVTFDQPPKDYQIIASTRFAPVNFTTTSVLRYKNSKPGVSGPLPKAPALLTHWSMKQARTFRRIILSNSAPMINKKQRYALADYFNITGVFTTNAIERGSSRPTLATSVLKGSLHEFVEIVFQNNENEIQSWHIDGNDFWVVGFGTMPWNARKLNTYNRVDAVTRHTVQVYPNSWTAILMSVENQGMWNIRSANWARQYLGQQFYFRVWTEIQSFRNEYDIPQNALLCGKAMKGLQLVELILVFLGCLISSIFVKAEDPYKLFTWTVTYGNLAPLGVSQQVILINGQFPGPRLDVVTNDNLIINVINKLDEPFLLTWNGIKQRKNSWQDGVLGTNCPIPPNSNYTYKMQPKDQIDLLIFPSTAFHKAAGGFGGINIYARPRIPVPYALPTADFTLLIGDWYSTNHKVLQKGLDSGKALASPDGLLLNGRMRSLFSGDQGKTYMFRITNIGLSTSINFRIQSHKMKLVECEGAHTIQSFYESLDIHVASTRFSRVNLTTTSVLRYTNSQVDASGPLPAAPTLLTHWSMKQARTFRWNLTANAARPNPQGSYHYGNITTSRRIILSNSAPMINGKQRYAVNGLSYVNPQTPLKLADYYNITGVFTTNAIERESNRPTLATSVLKGSLHEFVEIVFQNNENEIQSWHVDGNDFWVVGYVYPNSWTAILMSVENQGMWNIRSANWARQYLGQQFYFRVWTEIQSFRNEYDIPENALLCGKAAGRKIKHRQA